MSGQGPAERPVPGSHGEGAGEGRCGGPGALLPPGSVLGSCHAVEDGPCAWCPHIPSPQAGGRKSQTRTLLGTFWGFRGCCELWAPFVIAVWTCQQPPPPPLLSSRGERRRPGPEEQHLLLQLLPPLRPRAQRESLLRGGRPALAGLLPFFYLLYFSCTSLPQRAKGAWPKDLLPSPDSACRAAWGWRAPVV